MWGHGPSRGVLTVLCRQMSCHSTLVPVSCHVHHVHNVSCLDNHTNGYPQQNQDHCHRDMRETRALYGVLYGAYYVVYCIVCLSCPM